MLNKSMFDKVFLEAVAELKKRTPIDTGNLRDSIRYMWVAENQFVIYIDVGDTEAFVKGQKFDKGIAPYTPFVNEKWISPKWNGAQNPNENWWNDAIEFIIGYIARRLKGVLK